LTWWLDQKVQPTGTGHTNAADAPDFVVENFQATRMNLDGTERYAVIARKMVHYAENDSSVLDEPQLFHYDPQSATMSIRANQGIMSNNGENAYFVGDVHVRRAAYGPNPEMSLLTTYLHVIPDQDLVKTDREVTLTSGNSTLKGLGLEFNNKTREMKLLSDVKGQFETPAKDKAALPWERRR
jgi:lipopolysaccharide export system protein LptC